MLEPPRRVKKKVPSSPISVGPIVKKQQILCLKWIINISSYACYAHALCATPVTTTGVIFYLHSLLLSRYLEIYLEAKISTQGNVLLFAIRFLHICIDPVCRD